MSLRFINNKHRNLLIILFAMFVLSACGQKGDLYLPEDKQASFNTSSLPV